MIKRLYTKHLSKVRFDALHLVALSKHLSCTFRASIAIVPDDEQHMKAGSRFSDMI